MDIVMVAGMAMFFVLFIFLLFVFTVMVISFFIKKRFPDFEPDVSIVIPAYNEQRNIEACIKSITSDGYPLDKLEIIVVDDGSTDLTREVVRKYPVKLLAPVHMGKSAAMSLGAKSASHEFIITLDADSTLRKGTIAALIRPLSDKGIGATTGSSLVKNSSTLLGIFQNLEYEQNNLIRHSFSRVFGNGIWFMGALACYRKPLLEKIGYFKKDTLAEDMDVSLELGQAGFKTYNVKEAACFTIVPASFKAFYKQRSRWWIGVLQALMKHRRIKQSPSILFLYINQFWWSFYSIVSFPIIAYQVNYWLPSNSQSFASIAGYLFRWFTVTGPFYVLYKIPVWGISWYGFFGVLSGIISMSVLLASMGLFRDWRIRNFIALFFFFLYTIWLNLVIFISILRYKTLTKAFFIKEEAK
jgi:cellulose synthase/poly-beta-1,6-N-acetylglucosamine synthase-like glycosyltransferase